MRKAKYILLFLFLLVFSAGEIYAQYKPEQELSKKEKELFEVSLEAFNSENYIQSYQGFSQLLSLYPREPVFNFLYGASMIKQNYEIKKAFDYLEFAVGKGIPEANFYIGLGYHFLYDFDKAINFYNEFKATTKSKVWEEYNIDKYISQSENGKDLIRYAYELQVISNRQTAIKNFYYSYDLKNFGGEIIVKTERFKGKADKRIDETDLMYISNTNNIVLMSSYGESRKNSLDIYISYKTASGWSDPQKISETINTPFDEAYPFITEDGKTLYFSSKGHNSIGGYDIFRSFYNVSNNTWSTPENLDFPINTPYDDIMYASDRFGETAFFASTRESKTNQIGVYRILLEQEQLTRQIVSIEDVYHHASLSINSGAMAELTKRQEIRVNTIIDTTNLRTETIANIDSTSNIDDLFSQSFKSIEKHKSTAQELYEYANAAHTICQTHLQEIKDLNKELSSLKNKNDEKSVARRNDLNNQIIEKSTIAGEMYDLAKFFNDNAKQLNSLSDYYSGELEMLSNLPRSEKSLPEQIEKISREIKNINTSSPQNDYQTKLSNEISNKDSKLKNYNLMLQNQLDELNKINEKISLKLDLAKKEQDFTVREKYIYDIKTLENEKIDLISKIKENEVQIEFINYEIAQLNNRIAIITNSQYELENTLSYNPGLDLSKTKNEIELLKTHVSQNDLKQLAYKQDEILSDTKYYSQEIDLDAILYAGPDLADSELEEILIDTKSYTDKYSDILSVNALQTGDLVFKNDSLKEIIKNLELQFDSTTNNNEKQAIISEINDIKSEILSNNNIITDYLNSQTPVNLNEYLTEFESLKGVLQNTNYQNEIVETENLIAESKNLENDIKDLIVLGADQDNPPILYLEGMKSEIDNLIIQKIETMKAGEIIANTDSDQIIIKDLNYRINEISNNNIQEPINKITENFNRVELLYQDADKENDKFKKNELITNANNILDISVGENTQFINDQLLRNYEILGTYKNSFGDLSKKPTKTDEIISKIETLEQEAANLQLNAEDSQDELEKMKILAQAWDKLMLANQYYEYVFDIIDDEKNYRRNFEPTIDPEIRVLISQTNGIETKELVDITDADLADNNSTNSINEIETNTNLNNENNNVETSDNTNESDLANNNTEISDTSTNLDVENNLIAENTDSTINNVDNDITENNNPSDNIDTQNQNTETQQTGDLSDLTKKLDTVNYSGNIRISIKQQSKQKDEISKLDDEINKIKTDIENNTNNNKAEKLNQDLVNAQEKQIDGIIEYSITTNELLAELDSINYKISPNINNPQLDSLLRIQNEYRASVIGYSNFYTAEELHEKHLAAVAIENQIIGIYNSSINNTDKDILANALNNNNEINSSTNNNTNSNNEIDFSNKNAYTYNYNADIQTVKTLEKLENNIAIIESNIKTQENILADIESRMEYSNSSSEYKKLQKELDKENKKYLKQLKLWATNNKDYLSLKNNLADDFYYNSKSTSAIAAIVSDSLKSESETNINESIALFEIIITSKIADKNIIETYKKADRLSIEGLNMLNAANYLKNDGSENDPLIIAHYRDIRTNDQNETSDNNINITPPTDTITETEIIVKNDINTENENDILAENDIAEPTDSIKNTI
ncbi:MAG: PD40 domain-containing protein, partial [Bacteroidales bacterium]|nr:PD40 domain-containing protein [Bacteroidales bacterium]